MIAGMPPPGAFIRDPETFHPGQTFPSAHTGMYTRMPSSVADLEAMSTDEGGSGGPSQYKVTNNVIVRGWGGQYDWMKPPSDGTLCFSLATTQYDKGQLALLTVYNLNKMLNDGWNAGIDLLDNTDAIPEALRRRMHSTSTAYWEKISGLKTRLDRANESNGFSSLRFLSPELFIDRFLFAGWIEGTSPTHASVEQRALRVEGVIDNAENLWFHDLAPAEILYFILKRKFNLETKTYGAYALHPWAGSEHPPSSELTYKDINGVPRLGQVMYSGRFIQWTENPNTTNEAIAAAAGLTDTPRDGLPLLTSLPLRLETSTNKRFRQRYYMY